MRVWAGGREGRQAGWQSDRTPSIRTHQNKGTYTTFCMGHDTHENAHRHTGGFTVHPRWGGAASSTETPHDGSSGRHRRRRKEGTQTHENRTRDTRRHTRKIQTQHPSRTPGTLRSARRPYRHRSPPLRPTRCPNPRSSSPCTSMHKGLCMERMFHRRGRSLGRSSGEIRRTQDTQRHTSSAHAQHIPNSKRNTRPSRATRRQDTEPAAGKPSPAADELSTAADKLAAALATLSR